MALAGKRELNDILDIFSRYECPKNGCRECVFHEKGELLCSTLNNMIGERMEAKANVPPPTAIKFS